MIVRLLAALLIGGIIGLERELIGKEAGIRTSMAVSAGAALFAIIAVSIPFVISPPDNQVLVDILVHNSGFLAIIANIVVGVGFLGAGIIIKTHEHVFGLTTAAVVWTTAALGVLAGIGLIHFALAATIIFSVTLYLLRSINIAGHYARGAEGAMPTKDDA